MPVTRSRATSLNRREDAEALPTASRPSSPSAPTAMQYGGDAYSPAPADANTTFTGENVANIIESLQRSQTDAFRELLDSVLSARTSTPELLSHNTLARCKNTFSGREKESVEAFIDAIEAYSECAQVADSHIIRGLAFLFKDEAATWWQGIKHTITTWRQAKDNLISAYGDRRPPHRIYLEIFSSPQQTENTDIFVARKRALLARIPHGDISESAQLDMIYGLLHSRIRKRLRREECKNFSELLRLARNIEDSLVERNPTPTTSERSAKTSNTRSQTSNAQPAVQVTSSPPSESGTAARASQASGVAGAPTPQSNPKIKQTPLIRV